MSSPVDRIRDQIERLGGKPGSTDGARAPTVNLLTSSTWPNRYSYQHYSLDEDDWPRVLRFRGGNLSAGLIRNEPASGGYVALGYDEDTQYHYAVPEVCAILFDPPVYALDHEGDDRLGTPQGLDDWLRSLEIREELPQERFLAEELRHFRDDAFANLLRKRLHKFWERGILATSDLERVTKLDLSALDVGDIGGIEQCRRLSILDLADNIDLADAAPLADLRHLSDLNLSWTAVRDLSCLRGLPIMHLRISGLADVDLTPLLDLPKLRTADVGGLSRPEQQTALATLRERGVIVRGQR